jgi:hypothetical protein
MSVTAKIKQTVRKLARSAKAKRRGARIARSAKRQSHTNGRNF